MSFLDKIGLQDKLHLDDLYNTFLSLEKKQQTLASFGIIVILLVLMALPITCVSSKLSEKESEYDKYLDMASEFHGIQQQYSLMKSSLDDIKVQMDKLGFDPLKGILYNITDEIGVDRRTVTPKKIPDVNDDLFTEQGKDVQIQNIRFDQMVKLIDKLVNNQQLPVKIKKMTAKADPKNKQMIKSLTFTMTTMTPNK